MNRPFDPQIRKSVAVPICKRYSIYRINTQSHIRQLNQLSRPQIRHTHHIDLIHTDAIRQICLIPCLRKSPSIVKADPKSCVLSRKSDLIFSLAKHAKSSRFDIGALPVGVNCPHFCESALRILQCRFALLMIQPVQILLVKNLTCQMIRLPLLRLLHESIPNPLYRIRSHSFRR